MNDSTIRKRLLSAEQLLDAAGVLIEHERGRYGIYLAGLAVECALKALVLTHVPSNDREVFDRGQDFLGRAGHDYDRLLQLWVHRNGVPPSAWSRELRTLRTWSVEMRYETGRIRPRDATAFFESAMRLVSSIQERLG